MGLLDSMFSGGAPEYHAPQLNPETQKTIDTFKKENLAETPESIAAKSMQGVEQAAGAFQQGAGAQSDRDKALGSYDSGNMGAALQSKYKQVAQPALDKLKQMAQYSGYGKQFQHTQEEAGYALTLDNFARQNANMTRESQFAADSARNNVISSLLGVAGTAAGMAMAGGTKPTTTSGAEAERNMAKGHGG